MRLIGGARGAMLAFTAFGASLASLLLALLGRQGSDAAVAAFAACWPAFLVLSAVRSVLLAVALRSDPTTATRYVRLAAIALIGSAMLAVTTVGPLAPPDAPPLLRSTIAADLVIWTVMADLLARRQAGSMPSRARLLAALGVGALLAPLAGGPRWQTFEGDWPPHPIRATYAATVARGMAEWRETEPDHRSNLVPYDPDGPYLHYAEIWLEADEGSRLDRRGVPMVLADGEYHYSPVTVAQYALAVHARLLLGTATRDDLRAAADALLALQGADGAFRYPYRWTYYLTGETFEPGWISGMAQGQALSALARIHAVLPDDRYLEAGTRALDFLLEPVETGGPRSDLRFISPALADRPFSEEYLADPFSYTLNGYQFTLIGLYDWSRMEVPSATRAATAFDEGVASLRGMLPYYDLGGFTAYDLGHLTHPGREPHIAARYHAVHIYLLHALHDITGADEFGRYERLWAGYVEAAVGG